MPVSVLALVQTSVKPRPRKLSTTNVAYPHSRRSGPHPNSGVLMPPQPWARMTAGSGRLRAGTSALPRSRRGHRARGGTDPNSEPGFRRWRTRDCRSPSRRARASHRSTPAHILRTRRLRERAAGASAFLPRLGRASRLLSEALDQVEHADDLGAVADHLAVAGLAPAQHAVLVHDERRAEGDVAFLVEHAVRGDRRPVDVAQEREGEPARLEELGMAERAVAADPEQHGAAVLHLLGDLTEARELGRSDASPVVAIEDQDDVLAPQLGQRDRLAVRRWQ